MGKAKKNKKQKKLGSLLLLLFLTVIMLATSTYAWFTANKTVTIQNIDIMYHLVQVCKFRQMQQIGRH